jgi:hypothetical protein
MCLITNLAHNLKAYCQQFLRFYLPSTHQSALMKIDKTIAIALIKTVFICFALATTDWSVAQASLTDVQAQLVEESKFEPKWEPSEQDQLKIKLVSYQYLQAKENGEFETAFKAFSDENASAIEFKTWKYDQLIFNATAGASVDRTFTRVSWYESSPDNALPGIFVTVDYSSIFTNIDIQCGMLMWHKNVDGNFELIREQNNFIDKETQKKLSASEIEQTRDKFGCKK